MVVGGGDGSGGGGRRGGRGGGDGGGGDVRLVMNRTKTIKMLNEGPQNNASNSDMSGNK